MIERYAMNTKTLRGVALLMALLTLVSVALFACTTPNEGETTDTQAPVTDVPTEENTETPTDDATTGDGEVETDPVTPEYNVITIAEALEKCGEPGNITTERYYIRGIIQTVKNASYGQMVIADETGTIDVYGT